MLGEHVDFIFRLLVKQYMDMFALSCRSPTGSFQKQSATLAQFSWLTNIVISSLSLHRRLVTQSKNFLLVGFEKWNTIRFIFQIRSRSLWISCVLLGLNRYPFLHSSTPLKERQQKETSVCIFCPVKWRAGAWLLKSTASTLSIVYFGCDQLLRYLTGFWALLSARHTQKFKL